MESKQGGDEEVEVGDNDNVSPEDNKNDKLEGELGREATGGLKNEDARFVEVSKNNDNDMDTADGVNQDGVDVIDLRPDSDDSASEDDKDDSQLSGPSSGSGLIKKRKLSNSRNYRKNIDVVNAETGASEASSDLVNENVCVGENRDDQNKADEERPAMPALTDSDDSTDSASDVTLDTDNNENQEAPIPDLIASDDTDYNSDDDGDQGKDGIRIFDNEK